MKLTLGSLLAHLSIRYKLFFGFLLVSTLTLMITTTVQWFWDKNTLQQATLENARAISQSLQQNFVRMILLDDPDIAADTVLMLRSFPQITEAVLYNPQAAPVFVYQREDLADSAVPALDSLESYRIDANQISLLSALTPKNVDLGELYLALDTRFIEQWKQEQSRRAFVLVVVVSLLSILIAFPLESYLTTPLINLAVAMRRVQKTQNFSLRVETKEKNQIGQLYDSYNHLLSGMRQHDRELREHKMAMDEAAIVSVADVMGRITYANKKFTEISGYSNEELIGQNHRIVKSDVHSPEFYKQMWRVIASGQIWHGEICNRAKDGQYYWVDSTIVPFLDDRGKPVRYMGVRYPITDKKQAESHLQRLNHNLEGMIERRTKALHEAHDLLLESEKMAALGELVAGVAHEINTPIGIGVTAVSHLKHELEELRKALQGQSLSRTHLQEFIEDCDEGLSILDANLDKAVRQIRSFKQVASDQSQQEVRRFVLREYLDEILLSLRPALKKTRIEVQVQGDPEIEVNTDPGALSQIISNLVSNCVRYAFEAEEPGRIQIKYELDHHEQIRLQFVDDGKGMTEEELQRAFDPFFTTGRAIGGTGLGLHIVYSLVTKKLNGKIQCQSTPGQGVQFNIRFPADFTESSTREMEILKH